VAEPGWIVAAPVPEIRQRTQLDCGAAALAMVAGRWFVSVTIDDVLAATPVALGVNVDALYNAARALGLDAAPVANDRDILEFEVRAHRPVVIELMSRFGAQTRRHFEVVVAVRPSTREVATIDPARGWRVRHLDELDAEWQPSGRSALVVVGRTAESQALVPKPKVVDDFKVAARHRPEAWP
jgi:ABC-type bacteriocin/lantibiotic exporter with double-glycine peptidase domain